MPIKTSITLLLVQAVIKHVHTATYSTTYFYFLKLKKKSCIALVALERQLLCQGSYIKQQGVAKQIIEHTVSMKENTPSCHDDEKVIAISQGIDIENLTPEESPVCDLQAFGSFLRDTLLSPWPRKLD